MGMTNEPRKAVEVPVRVFGTDCDGKPFYEQHGEARVAAGVYDRVLRYRDHVVPVAEALWSHSTRGRRAGHAPRAQRNRAARAATHRQTQSHPCEDLDQPSLLRDFGDRDGDTMRFAFAIGPAGGRVSQVRDAYAHAFILFAIASLYRLNGDPALLDIADRTLRRIGNVQMRSIKDETNSVQHSYVRSATVCQTGTVRPRISGLRL